jgi:putative iron-regulated protein
MRKYSVALLFAGLALVSSCKKDEDDESTTDNTENYSALKTAAVSNYSDIVEASYSDAISTAEALKTTIDAFVAAPSASGLESCKTAWLASRIPYGQTEAFRFYEGPIDNGVDGPEGSLNAWPLDEVFIDYTRDMPEAGIINDVDYKLTATNLRADNEKTDTYIVIGYHAIEFMLWGQDYLDPTNGKAGTREFTDYTTADNADRRKLYLGLVADLLIEDLESVHTQWATNGSYRTNFESDANMALSNILTGIGELSGPELSGERMQTALSIAKTEGASIGQEDEHSCFSDNTHNDIILNFLGCQNVLLGTYKKVDGVEVSGTSLIDIINERNSDLASQLEVKATEALTSTEAIDAPFDVALTNDQADIEASIAALKAFSLLVADAKLAIAE